MDPEKIKQKLADLLKEEAERNSYAKSADVVKLFKVLTTTVQKIHPALSKDIEGRFKASLSKLDSTERKLSSLMDDAKRLRDTDLKKYTEQVQRDLKDIRNTLSELPSIDDVIGFFERAVENLEPPTPIETRDSLESIKEEEEKLSIEAIKDLRRELDELKKLNRRATNNGGGGITGRDIIKSYDLSPLLDGVNKTFAIPGNWTVLSVSGTSFPYQFRRLVDYTFTPQEITFTSEITADTSLATGQTVEILYVSA